MKRHRKIVASPHGAKRIRHHQTVSVSEQRERIFQTATVDNSDHFSLKDWALFVSIALIWGSSFLLIAFALEDFTPGTITLARVGLGALTLGAVRAARPSGQRIESEDWPRIVLLSFLWVGIPFTLFPLAQEYINSAVTGLLNGAMPIFAALVATVLFKTAPKGLQLAGIGLGFLGIIMISVASAGGESSEAIGVLMVLGATVCYGFAVNLAGPLQQKYGAIGTMFPVLALATVWVTPFGLWGLADNGFSIGSAVAVFILGAVGTGAAYWIMATLVGRVGAVRASFITYLIPVVSLVLGVVFRDDEVTVVALIGAVLTIGGALMASRRESR
ncbi:MAG: DMT family transporter [Acidimicrobiales bacterium]|nr:DMT family transporter [Acidimicrobiales bacterium]RZV45780.1 MAG: DMT family transporter [Acidimicrobiales bacterium]